MIDRFGNPTAFQFLWLLPLLIFLSWFLIRIHRQNFHQQLGEKYRLF